jgi:hypothetical protein
VSKGEIPNDWIGVDGLYKVTPAIAAEMLRMNVGNRKVDTRKVSKYAQLISDGKWKDNGQTIGFDDELRLMNGQHRLMACIEAGIPFKTRIAWGVDPNSFDTIDVGKARSTGQVLLLAGEKNTLQLSSVLRMVIREEMGYEDVTSQGKKDYVESIDIVEALRRHPEARASVDRCVSQKGLSAIMPVSVSGYLHYRVFASCASKIEEFLNRLSDGIDLSKTSPMRLLRERMLQYRGDASRRPTQAMTLALTVKAWNAHSRGLPMQLLRWMPEGEPFPKIYGARPLTGGKKR